MKYARASEVITRRIGDEVLLVPVRQNVGDLESLFTLNETGASLWEALGAPADESGLVEQLQREFDVDAATASADVQAFLAELATSGLVAPVGEAHGSSL